MQKCVFFQKQDDRVSAVYQPIRRQLSMAPKTDVAHLLAARQDLLNVEKTSSGAARERSKCDINRVLIGKVGRTGSKFA